MNLSNFFPAGISALFSERADGSCALHSPGSLENRAALFSQYGISEFDVVKPTLVHSSIVMDVGKEDIAGPRVCDALVTGDEGVFLSVTAADCPPLYLYDPGQRVIALVHCGWRGISQNIIFNTLEHMRAWHGTKPADCIAVIGPGIGSCHFEVQKDCWDALRSFSQPVKPAFVPGARHTLELQSIIANQLLRNGFLLPHIRIVFECTACNPQKYFSWRRDRAQDRMIAVLGMQPIINPYNYYAVKTAENIIEKS